MASKQEQKRSLEGECCSDLSVGRKKPRLAAGEGSVAAEMNDVYRSGDFLERMTHQWRCVFFRRTYATIIL